MDMASKESISIPFGTGICGHVAETKETIYIKDAYNVSHAINLFVVKNNLICFLSSSPMKFKCDLQKCGFKKILHAYVSCMQSTPNLL